MKSTNATRPPEPPGPGVGGPRDRLIDSAIRLVAAEGRGATTVGRLVEDSGVSRTAYYAIFGDVAQCFEAAQEHGRRVMADSVTRSWRRGTRESWPDRVVGSLSALMSLLDEQPALARAVLIELDHFTPVTQRRAEEARSCLADALAKSAEASHELPADFPLEMTPSISRLAVGAGAEVLIARLKQSPLQVRDAMPDVAGAILAPFLGPRSAAHIWS